MLFSAGASISGGDVAFVRAPPSSHGRLCAPPIGMRPGPCVCGERPTASQRCRLRAGAGTGTGFLLSASATGKGEKSTGEKSKYSIKFDSMLERVHKYSLAQVMCVDDEVTRKIITGLVEGSKVPEVEVAFRILYEDYPPIRLAGNLLFDMIDRAVESCPTLEFDDADSADPLTEKAMMNARNLFTIADVDGSGHLDQSELRSFLETLSKVGWTIEVDEKRLLQVRLVSCMAAALAAGKASKLHGCCACCR